MWFWGMSGWQLVKLMVREMVRPTPEPDYMRSEYDFAGGVRGKYVREVTCPRCQARFKP